MHGCDVFRVGRLEIIWWYLLTMFPSLEQRLPATRGTRTRTAEAVGTTGLSQKVRRWQGSRGIEEWHPKSRSAKGPSMSIHASRRPAAVRTRSLLPAKSTIERNTQLCKYDPQSSVKHGGAQASAESYPRDIKYPPLSSWQTSPSADLTEFEKTSPYVSHHNEYQSTASSAARGPRAQPPPPYQLGYHTRSTDQGYHNMEYPGYTTPMSGPIYSGQRDPMDYATNSFHQPEVNIGTHDSVFLDLDFCNTRPRTVAEVAFVKSALEYTRSEYKSWMGAEPPQTCPQLSYIEQYREIQAHLEQRWPYSYKEPMKLRAMGPVFGGLDQL